MQITAHYDLYHEKIDLDNLEGFRIKQMVRNLNLYEIGLMLNLLLSSLLLSPIWMVPEPWRSWLMEPE